MLAVSCSKERSGYTVVEGYALDAITGKAMPDLELQICGKIRYLSPERAYCRVAATTVTEANGHYRLEFSATDNDRNYSLEVFGAEHYTGNTSIPLQTGVSNRINLRLRPFRDAFQ
jgi:hypothetical protein